MPREGALGIGGKSLSVGLLEAGWGNGDLGWLTSDSSGSDSESVPVLKEKVQYK